MGATVALLGAFGVLIGLAMSPLLVYYAVTDPAILWQAGGATALFILGFGTAGYLIRSDLSALARVAFFALLALIVFGIVLIFVHIPHGSLIYAVLGLVIFAVFTMFDFQRLRRSKDVASAPLMAASIFLDILNVFLFFLRIFEARRTDGSERPRSTGPARAWSGRRATKQPDSVDICTTPPAARKVPRPRW